jgi:hypothetical protein
MSVQQFVQTCVSVQQFVQTCESVQQCVQTRESVQQCVQTRESVQQFCCLEVTKDRSQGTAEICALSLKIMQETVIL